MRLIKSIGIALVVVAFLASCKKDAVSNHSIHGTWIGLWGYDNDAPEYYYKLEIKPGGELVRYNENNEIIGTGNWNVNGVNFSGNYTMTGNGYNFSIAALYSDIAGEITGTWGETPSSADGGTFDLHKQ